VDACVSREEEYREHAAELVRLAQRASSSTDKVRLLAMAEAWLKLVDHICETRNRGAKAERFAEGRRE
jgi:hypothetical protein